MKFKIDKYTENRQLYLKQEHEFNEGVTILVGCNGSGKSTLLKRVRDIIVKNEDICVLEHFSRDEERFFKDRCLRAEDYGTLSASMQGSEGENISIMMGTFFSKVGYTRKQFEDKEKKFDTVFMIMDSIDSGWSIDQYKDFNYVLNLIISDFSSLGVKVYCLISSNTYELVEAFNSYDVQHNKYVKFKSYDDYRKFVVKSRELKEKYLDAEERRAKMGR